MFLAKSVLLPVYRNLVAAIDRICLVWQIAFSVVYIFVAGYAYSAMIGDQAINQDSLSVTYTSFLLFLVQLFILHKDCHIPWLSVLMSIR